MNESNGLYTATIQQGPNEINNILQKIPHFHRQEVLDTALEKSVTLTTKPKFANVEHLLSQGANPNGSAENKGFLLSYAYTAGLYEIVELLLNKGADPNAAHCYILEQAVRKGDLKYVVRFVEAGADINDTDRLLFCNDLLSAAKNYPEIQKYLIRKGIQSDASNISAGLMNIVTPSIQDFEYPVKKNAPVSGVNLEIKDYSAKFFTLQGDTINNQALIKKHGGRFIRGKWLLPITVKDTFAAEASLNGSGSNGNDDNGTGDNGKTPEGAEDAEYIEYVKTVWNKNSVKRPEFSIKDDIELYTSSGVNGYLTIGYEQPNLFKLDSHAWDSVERYLMYKMYEGSAKGKAIKEAPSLNEARRKFSIQMVPIARTPRQLVINQKLQPLAQSKVSKGYLQNKSDIFYKANKEKFTQNQILKNRLQRTGSSYIINKNPHDSFGYEGNLLGNTLMQIRASFGGPEFNKDHCRKTNNLIIEKYNNNDTFYVIRGDPDGELAAEIRNLGTFKTKSDKLIRGKLNLNLQGGPGWLIPASNKDAAETLIFKTFPEEKKIEITGQRWIERQLDKYLNIAITFARFRGKQEVGSDDILFVIKDIFGEEEFLGFDDDQAADDFVQSVWRYFHKQDFTISDGAIKLLWNFLAKVVEQFTSGIEDHVQMEEIINNFESTILNTEIRTIDVLTERESIIVSSFLRLHALIKKMHDKDTKVCVTVIHMMLGKEHYEKIRQVYAQKAKMNSSKYSNLEGELMYRKRFHIKSPHIEAILNALPKDMGKKCKLLLLTTVDYIMELEGKEAISISKRLIALSHKGRIVTPTPAVLPTPLANASDIPKESIESIEEIPSEKNKEKVGDKEADKEAEKADKTKEDAKKITDDKNNESESEDEDENEKDNNEESSSSDSGDDDNDDNDE